jgi:hypothetical protein
MKSNITLFDKYGRSATPAQKLVHNAPKKQALGLYGNIYNYPEYGNFRPRFYTLSDSEQGLDSISRELVVRWSREMTAQLPFVGSAIKILADFVVGTAYLPEYVGENEQWGKDATDWLLNDFYPNCCTRGSNYPFQTCMNLESRLLDTDGDFLCIYGFSSNGFPKFQIVPSHRIRSLSMDNKVFTADETPYGPGILCDGVLYNMAGKAIGYNVQSIGNLVTNMPYVTNDQIISAKDATLIYDPVFFDKGRGMPSIGPAILKALSIQELDSYLVEKIKIESCVGLIESTPSGEAPMETAQILAAMNTQALEFGSQFPQPDIHGVEVVQGPSIRYIRAQGGELKTLGSNTPADQTMMFIKRLETQILSCIGVPHQLIYSPQDVSGKITTGIAEVFKSSITRRQSVLDKHGKFLIAWALANAQKAGLIPKNDKENFSKVFELSHPNDLTMDEGWTRSSDLADYKAGLKSLNDITTKGGKGGHETILERGQEAEWLVDEADRISKKTGKDFDIVLSILSDSIKPSVRISKNDTTGTMDTTAMDEGGLSNGK